MSRKVTKRLPSSIISPRVGQLDAESVEVDGEYETWSKPADSKTVAYSVGATLSMFTIKMERTALGVSQG